MAKKRFKNNVTRLLDARKVSYQVLTYEYGPETHAAVEVARAVGLPPEEVFKTLVALANDPGQKPILALIPGPATLDLKKLAKAVGVKKVQMAPRAQAESLTGLQAGGISPLALLNRGFQVYLDESAQALDWITVSAGQRGAQVRLPVADLVQLTRARLAPLTA